MANIFTSLKDLLEDILSAHSDSKKLGDISDALVKLNATAERIEAKQGTIQATQETMQADLLSIKAFLGVPDVRNVATQEQLDELSARIQKQKEDVQTFDASIPK